MIRKLTGACIVFGLFFLLTLNASASPLSDAPQQNGYTHSVFGHTQKTIPVSALQHGGSYFVGPLPITTGPYRVSVFGFDYPSPYNQYRDVQEVLLDR